MEFRENREILKHLRMVLDIQANGIRKLMKEMGKECRFGWMAVATKDIGKKTKQMAKVDLFMPMVMCMKATGLMIKLMVKVLIRIWMEPSILDSGKKISNMARARKHGLMEHNMKDSI